MPVSVIIPVHNCAKFLASAIDSALSQTAAPYEIIVVDDGSTDGSGEIAARYGAKVKLVRQENSGPAKARNCGVAKAAGAVLAFLDADDLWHPQKLERQINALATSDLVFCTITKFFSDDCPPEMRGNSSERDQQGFLPSALVCRASTFDQVGPFDESLKSGEFVDWLARARTQDFTEKHLENRLVKRRIHGGNMTRDANLMQEYLKVIRRNIERRKHP